MVFWSAAAGALAADAFPNKPVRIIVNTAPGGLTDVTTRLVAEKMREALGQPVIVDNRAGADGLLGIRAVKGAAADGYTLLATAGTIAIQPAVKQDPGYDLMNDFTGVGPMVRAPLLMLSATSQPYKTLPEFIAHTKAHASSVSYASAGVGTTTHIGAATFLQQAGIDPMHVPYKGNGAAMSDVIAGRVDMIFEAYGSGAPHVKDGRLRALGVTSAKRLAALPDVPTVAEQGMPNYSYYLWLGIVAPAGTPKPVIDRLSQAVQTATGSKDLRDRMLVEGSEAMSMSAEEFNRFLKQESARMAKVVADLKLEKQ